MISLITGHDDMDNFEAVCRAKFGHRMSEMLPDDGDCQLITLRRGTESGRPIVMITFQVDVGDGVLQRAQTVVTMREFLAAADAMRIRYGGLL